MKFLSSFKSLWNNSGKIRLPKEEYIPAPKPEPISCIVQCILDDLDVKNKSKWKYNTNSNFIIYFLDYKAKAYSLYVTRDYYGRGISAGVLGIKSTKFSDKEISLIIKAAYQMYNLLKDKELEKQRMEEKERLAKLFPECFEKHYIKLPPKPKKV